MPSTDRLPTRRPWLGDLLWGLVFLALFLPLAVRNFALGRPDLPVLSLGPFTLGPFGLLAGANILFGYYLIQRWCRRFRIAWPTLLEDLLWIIGIGLFLSHVTSMVAYFPEDLSLRTLLDIRYGISSFGGIFGGGLVAIVVLRLRRLPLLRHLDALALGFVGGYVFGRLGCFAIHDHPGRETDVFLAVEIAGVRRHDLGLYEMFLMLVLLAILLGISRRGRPADGSLLAVAALLYSPARFFLDSLRVADPRYAGLTPGQWACLPFFALGGFLALRIVRARRARRRGG